MYLKRKHDTSIGPDGQPVLTVSGVELIHTGLSAEQNWDRSQLLQYATEGWMRLVGETIEIVGEQETLVYDILRKPGYYVASTGEQIPISELAMGQFLTEPVATLASAEARAFLLGRGLPQNDYDAGRVYRCRLRADQHEKWRAVRDLAGNAVAAHTITSAEA